MATKPNELNIYQKLAKVRKAVEVIQKNKDGYGYKYVSDDAILARLTVIMDKLGLSLIPRMVPGTFDVTPYSYTKTKYDKNTRSMVNENVNEVICKSEMTLQWVNNDNPEESITVPWALVGQQSDASQSFGSGLTYSYRYFLLKYFGIATPSDDPDEWRRKQKDMELEEDKAIAKEIVDEIDTNIRAFLAANPTRKDDVRGLITTYVKSGDYTKITESALAAKLLADFNNKFITEE